jgi:high-affinity Fe2+/Pb2+ permease
MTCIILHARAMLSLGTGNHFSKRAKRELLDHSYEGLLDSLASSACCLSDMIPAIMFLFRLLIPNISFAVNI